MLILDYLLHNFYDPPQELVDQVIVDLIFIMLDIFICYTPPLLLSNELTVMQLLVCMKYSVDPDQLAFKPADLALHCFYNRIYLGLAIIIHLYACDLIDPINLFNQPPIDQ